MLKREEMMERILEGMGKRAREFTKAWSNEGHSVIKAAQKVGMSLQRAYAIAAHSLFKLYEEVEGSSGDIEVNYSESPSLEWLQTEIKRMYDNAKVQGEKAEAQKWFKMLLDFRHDFGEQVDQERMRVSKMTNEELARYTLEAVEELKKLGEKAAWYDSGALQGRASEGDGKGPACNDPGIAEEVQSDGVSEDQDGELDPITVDQP